MLMGMQMVMELSMRALKNGHYTSTEPKHYLGVGAATTTPSSSSSIYAQEEEEEDEDDEEQEEEEEEGE